MLLPPEPLFKAIDQRPAAAAGPESCTTGRESRTLAELRDTLLGPLLSGELTIKSAEKAVGAAL